MSTSRRPWRALLVGTSITLIPTIAVIAVIAVSRPTIVGGAAAQLEEGYQYTATFACFDEVGPPEGDGGSPVIPARYRTVVNIHNPQRHRTSISARRPSSPLLSGDRNEDPSPSGGGRG